jgi:hypothetical protein
MLLRQTWEPLLRLNLLLITEDLVVVLKLPIRDHIDDRLGISLYDVIDPIRERVVMQLIRAQSLHALVNQIFHLKFKVFEYAWILSH